MNWTRLSPSVLALVLSATLPAQVERKVLIIGIDGCRPDALVQANCPNIDGLMATGIHTLQGNTHPPTISGPGWSSMLCGVWEQKHGVLDNSFGGSQYGQWPHFMDRLQALDPALQLVSICHWAPINTTILANADLEMNVATDALVASNAVQQLTNADPDILFLHFDDVDAAGHANGHVPTSPTYIAAIESVDAKVGQVLAALDNRPANEEWLVCVVTDHGGNASGHGGITPEEQRIFAIYRSPLLEPAQVNASIDTPTIPAHVSFNSTGHVQVQNSAAYQFGTAQDLTLECRVKMPTTWGGDPCFVGNKNWNSGANAGFALSTNTTGGTWKFNIGDGVDRVDLSGLPITDGQWHHLAVTCDRNGMVRIFQDGLFLREAPMSAIGSISTALALRFGQDGTGTYGTSMPGALSEVRIWNAALPINTVSEWSGKALTNAHPYQTSLIGHWRLDEGSGTNFANQVAGGSAAQWVGSAPAWQPAGALLRTTDLSRTPAQVDLVPTVLAHLCIANDPAWQLDGRSMIPVCAPVTADLHTLLEGPYDTGLGLMHDSLRTQGLIPLQEPFSAQGFEHAGSGGDEQRTALSTTATGANAIIDWILVEQRDGNDPTRVLSTRSALLQRDGDIVDLDGTSLLTWKAQVGNHRIAIRHRNHLGVMTGTNVPFQTNGIVVRDLSDPAVPLFGLDAMRDLSPVRLQWAGNARPDGTVAYTGNANDRDVILQAIGGVVPTNTATGYRTEDVNLDGVVKYTGTRNDRDAVLRTVGGIVPTNTRAEQLP